MTLSSGQTPRGPADAGATERPAEEQPATECPATECPATERPAEERPAGAFRVATRRLAGAVPAVRATAAAALAGLGSVLVLVGLTWLPARSPVALGSCVQPSMDDAIARGSVIFVGTVVGLENDERWATVRVEERWYAAAALPDDVKVRGGSAPGTSTTVDRAYASARYLFAVEPGPGYYQDSGCTATTAWRDDLARYRPDGVVPATGNPLPTSPYGLDDALIVGALLTALAIAVISYLLILRARRRPPDWVR